jgi:hypothetical protein
MRRRRTGEPDDFNGHFQPFPVQIMGCSEEEAPPTVYTVATLSQCIKD